MTVQTLIPTMHQTDYSVLEKMNIKTDAFVVNQCDSFSRNIFERNGKKIEFYSLPERGIGLSRNFSLMRASGDIILFSDDDIRYYDDYESQIIKAFEENPDADMIAFNLDFKGGTRKRKKIEAVRRVKPYKTGSFGAARIAVKLEAARKNNLSFSLLFGGGAKYSAGEDVLFVTDAIRAGMRMYEVPITVGEIEDSVSTWFKGHNEKFFYDKGVLFAAMGKKTAFLRCVRYVMLYSGECKDIGVKNAFRLMLSGSRNFKKR